jgi:TonB family protein
MVRIQNQMQCTFLLAGLIAGISAAKADPPQTLRLDFSEPTSVGVASATASSVLFNYKRQVARSIKRRYFPARGGGSPTIEFSINPDGSVGNIRVSLSSFESSGSVKANEAAIQAVKAGAPFPKLPEGITKPVAAICRFGRTDLGFEFYVNVCVQWEEAAKLKDEANAAFAAQKYADATTAYVQLYNMQGYDCINRFRLLEVLTAYAASIKDDPITSRKHLYQVLRIDSYPPARKKLNGIIRSLGVNPDSFDDRLELARAASREGQTELAIGEYKEALRLKFDEGAQFELWKLLTRFAVEEEVVSWKEFLARHPGTAQGHLGLGEAYTKLEQPDKAKLEFQRALEIDPACETAKEYLVNPPIFTGAPNRDQLPTNAFRQW